MKKRFFYLTAILLSILFMAGCGKKVSTYNYNVNDIKHCDNLYIKKTVYYEDRVEIYFNSRNLENISFCCESLGNWSKEENKNNKLILYSDKPENITALSAHTNWYEVYFRYLDSDKYATIWCFWADDLGCDEYKGDKDKYYTPEELSYQAQAAAEAAQRAKEREEQSREICESIKGIWVSDDGDYFEITNDPSPTLLYFEAEDNMYTECPGIEFSMAGEGKTIKAFEAPYGWGAYYGFDLELSEDGESFVYNEKTFYHADKNIWSEVDADYIQYVKALFDNAGVWEMPEAKYAVTDLNMNGLPEVMVSGFSEEDNAYFSSIYEINESKEIVKIKDDNLLKTGMTPAPLTLFKVEESPYYYFEKKYQDVYEYLVCGEEDNGEGKVRTQYFLMSLQINALVLEEVVTMESNEDENGDKSYTYYDDKAEIGSEKYARILSGVRDETVGTAEFAWFDDISLENMAKSFSVFYESMNYDEEE